MQPDTHSPADPAAAPPADNGDITVKSIKGFNHDLTCRDFQFAIGETYVHTGLVEACASGFHACDGSEHPLSVFAFYPPGGAAGKGPARYCEVTQGGTLSREEGCTKIASARLTVDFELSIGDLVMRAWEFVWSRVKRTDETTATGYQGGAQATGNRGGAQATGYQGGAQATGYQGGAQATGYQGGAQATGYQGGAQATGTRGVAVSIGYEGWVLGEGGNLLVAVERSFDGDIVSHATGMVGQDGIEPNVRYRAVAGRLVRA